MATPGLRPWPRLRPQKTVSALHVSKSFGVFADDKSSSLSDLNPYPYTQLISHRLLAYVRRP